MSDCIHCDNWGCSRCGRSVKDLTALLNAQQQLLEAAHGRAKEREVELTRRAQDMAELRAEVVKLQRLLVDAVAERDRNIVLNRAGAANG